MQTKARPSDKVSSREQLHQQLSYEIATEAIVLLENNGVLPLAPCPVALYGAGAEYTVMGGSGSGEVNVRHHITIKQGLTDAGFHILTNDWISRYDRQWKAGKQAFLKAARRKLIWPTESVFNDLMSMEYRYPSGDSITQNELNELTTDTCLYVLSRRAGEGHDMKDEEGSYRIDTTELNNIRLCASHFRRMVLIINTCSPIDLSPLDSMPGVDAIVYMGQLGMEGGRALADMLMGKTCPSGRLAVSWAEKYRDIPFADEFALDSEQALYKEGIYVGYRYFDSFDVQPRYPFGYGLSYTAFKITNTGSTISKDIISCSFVVTNTGKQYSGKEVVQVYVRCPGEDREYQRLVAFAKTHTLLPDESETLNISFPVSTLSEYKEGEAETVVSKGKYLILAGSSSRQTRPVAVLMVKETLILSRHKNLCQAKNTVAELIHNNNFDIPQGLPELVVGADAVKTIEHNYSLPPIAIPQSAKSLLDSLSAEDMITLCVGTGMMGEKHGFHTPGAVGHTTTAFLNKGVPNVELCDGPAGLRIEKRAVQYPNGEIKSLDISISVYEFFPPLLLKWMILGDEKKGTVLYQFVTAFPIEAMVAQTWNLPLVEQMGKAVSAEMQEYGVTFWLAPAMNIVRNPLCGRNFEYYSEDPLLTGKMAAAATRGMQTVNTYATVKHFAVNNQETNRFNVSSEVDERTLREIYWRGFEIVMNEAQPKAVMSAYNKINGTYCSNNYDLCTNLLRCEWGFKGVVMTDWMATNKGRADLVKCIPAGVDMIMPGDKKEVKALLKALHSNLLSQADLRAAAGRVLQLIMPSQAPSDGCPK